MNKILKEKILAIIYGAKWHFEGSHIGGEEIEVQYFMENEDVILEEIAKLFK